MRDSMPLAVFGGSGSPRLTAAICGALGVPPGRCETRQFSDGNTFVRVLDNVRGKDVYVIQTFSRPVNDRLVEMLFFVDAFRRASAGSITAVIPFFSYGKGDKKDEPRVSIRARVCADCLEASGVDRIVTMDLHAPQIQGFFRVPVDHLYGLPLLVETVRRLPPGDPWTVVAPDVGYGQMARLFAKALGAQTAIAEKVRRGHDEKAHVERIIGSVAGARALVVDDFVTTGGTLIATAERLLSEGATEVYAAVTHGVLGPGAARAIEASPLREVVITDTLEHEPAALGSRIRVVSAAPLFAEAIRSIHDRTSVSRLFEV
ncbi:MAG: ribose-phosphate pyrophosphokinase [Phycisphaerae bacterium]|nr:ribose-phosphate pyrophosphokinase [Phycisphaerae bacterium]